MTSDGALLVVGGTGILGRAVTLEASRRSLRSVVATYHRRAHVVPAAAKRVLPLDIADAMGVIELFSSVRPSVVINCAGLTKALSYDLDAARRANVVGPRNLEMACDYYGARLVHVSTDCVFDGKCGPYSEDNEAKPRDIYGMTKLEGEVTKPPHLTVRTSFIGAESGSKNGLLAWFLQAAGEVPGFTNHLWSGSTVAEIARVLLDLAFVRTTFGLLHVAGPPISKHELLILLREHLRPDLAIVPVLAPETIDRRLISVRSGVSPRLPPIEALLAELSLTLRHQNR